MIVFALALGAALGFISSMPPGPINLHLSRRMLELDGNIKPFLAGTLFADVLIALLALQGLTAAHLSHETLRWIEFAGGAVLVTYALVGVIFRQKALSAVHPAARKRYTSDFLMGFLFCALNPGFYLFWVYGASVLSFEGEPGMKGEIAYLVGILIGDLLWFSALNVMVRKFLRRVDISVWSYVSFGLTGCFGLYSIWRSVFAAV